MRRLRPKRLNEEKDCTVSHTTRFHKEAVSYIDCPAFEGADYEFVALEGDPPLVMVLDSHLEKRNLDDLPICAFEEGRVCSYIRWHTHPGHPDYNEEE